MQSQVRFNRVPEKAPEEVPGGFGAEPGQVQHGSGEGSGEGLVIPKVPGEGLEALVQSQVRLNRQGSGEGSEEGSRKPWCKAKSSSMVSGEGLGGFGAQPGQVQQGFGEGFGEGLGGFGSGEGSGEGVGGFGAEPGQVQQGSGEGSGQGSGRLRCRARSSSTGLWRRFRRRSGRFWCRARSGSTGSGEGEGHLTHGNLAEVFPALDFPARFRKIYKN